MRKIGVGLIGFGTVGVGVVKILQKNASLLRQRLGVSVEIKKIADLDIKTSRGVSVEKGVLTTNAGEVIDDPGVDIVVELMGGIEPAGEFIMRALKNGKHVVTANKALLAEQGLEIFAAASKNSVDIAFEASVGGGIPIIRAVQESLSSDRITGIFGILNGTANYILSRMADENGSFKDILKDAQAEGYAETDPTFDVEGIDTQHKLAILIGLAFGKSVNMQKIYTEGITKITPLDVEFVNEMGYKIKLLAVCRGTESEVEARVHPVLIPESHLLSKVSGAFNAIFLQSKDLGPTMFYGKGAGMMPTGSAVVADIMSLARNIVKGSANRVLILPCGKKVLSKIKIKPIKEIQTRYYLRFTAEDKPGVLSRISGILGRNSISIHSVVQKGRQTQKSPVSMLTHEAKELNLQKALRQIDRLSVLRRETMVIRIEDGLQAD